MSETLGDVFNLLGNIGEELAVGGVSEEERQLIDKFRKNLLITGGKMYSCSLGQLRRNEAGSKKVTSVAIHKENQQFIDVLQSGAKESYFFLSKEVIVNMALKSLFEYYVSVDGDVKKVVDHFVPD